MMKLYTPLRMTLAVTALAVGGQSALAAPDVRVSGFGTLGYVTTDTNDAQFRTSVRQHKGATQSDGDWGVDSRLGLQANVTFNDMFSAVGQLYVARRDGHSAPRPEWLFLQAKFSDSVSVRAGRMVLPTFMLSDSRHVGYAQHWLRTPVEVYGALNTTSFDGLQGVFHHQLGRYNLTAQLSAGEAGTDKIYGKFGGYFMANEESSDKVYSANLAVEHGDWTARIGHSQKRETKVVSMGQLVAKGDDKFTGVGVQYDNGDLLAMSEYIWRHWRGRGAQDGAYDSKAFYLTAGYRFGALMPYATYSRFSPDGRGYAGGRDNRKTKAIGLRWDAVRNIALKAQIEDVSGGVGDQFIPEAIFQARQPSTRVYSAGVDFIF